MKVPKFEIGDMVQFDSYENVVGIVIDIKESVSFDAKEAIRDILVCWSNGHIFWCLDFTLILLSKKENIRKRRNNVKMLAMRKKVKKCQN